MFKKWVLIILLILILIPLVGVGIYFIYPDVSALKKNNPRKTAFMEFREGEWKKAGQKKQVRQKWVPLSQISQYAIKAVIIAEDDKFWSHEGFDFEAMQKALEKDIKQGKFKVGGSTISQQLAKNLFLSPSKNPIRKLKEAILTWRLERDLTKKRIMELYLNVAEWGDTIFGIEVAARHYYGKPAADLTAEEAAKLASVLPNPRVYNPIGTSRYVTNRSQRIYEIMVRRGIVIEEYEEMISGPAESAAQESPTPKQQEHSPGPAPSGESSRVPAPPRDGGVPQSPSAASSPAAIKN